MTLSMFLIRLNETLLFWDQTPGQVGLWFGPHWNSVEFSIL